MESSKAPLLRFLEATDQTVPTAYLAFTLLLGTLGFVALYAFPLAALLLLIDVIDTLAAGGEALSWPRLLVETTLLVLVSFITFCIARTKMKLPKGRRLTQHEAPALFQLIEELRAHFGSPKIHRIVVTPHFELELVRTPQFGFPLIYTNTLSIGLPLMQSVSPLHLKVLLARKVGQLAGAYHRPRAWMYYLRPVWPQYRDTFSTGWMPHQLIMRALFSWYAPVFAAVALYAARRDEFTADACAMDVVNDYDVAEGLAAAAVGERFREQRFLPALMNQAKRHAAPPYLPHSGFERALQKGLNKALAKQLLTHAMQETSNYRSVLPALKERLDAIGYRTAPAPNVAGTSSAVFFLVGALHAVQQEMDRIWLDANLTRWREEHANSEQERQRLKVLLHRASQALLSDQDAWECTLLIQKHVEKKSDITRLYKGVLRSHPKDARVNFVIGRYLLSQNDSEGIKALESAMALDDHHTVTACKLITRYMVNQGERKDAQAYRRRALAYQAEIT